MRPDTRLLMHPSPPARRGWRLLPALLALLLGGPPPPAAAAPSRPRIEVVFVLDTTGSMSGLIEGAKRKIWSIADRIASTPDEPEVRMGLLAYRDRGDAYVTSHQDLSNDLDALWSNLRGLQAAGGGDGPESVNQALHEAVTRTAWSPDDRVYRAIFLVGDAPPHMDYDDDVLYPSTLSLARQRGVVVNTVQCGSDATTEQIWREIALAGEGYYASIASDGGMLAVETPYDEELSTLQARLAATVVPWGSREERASLYDKLSRPAAAPAPEAAARLSYLSKHGAAVVSGRSDLVDAVGSGRVALESLPAESLPPELAALDAAGRAAYLEARAAERARLNQAIAETVRRRDAFLEEDARRRARAGAEQGFDERVIEAIREQLLRTGRESGEPS